MSSAAALRLTLQHLSASLVYTDSSNVETNRKLWNQYAKQWKIIKQKKEKLNQPTQKEKTDDFKPSDSLDENSGVPAEMPEFSSGGPEEAGGVWLEKMCRSVGRELSEINYLGEEWSDYYSFDETIQEFLLPLLPSKSSNFHACEVGVGGGRVASRYVGKVEKLVCFDVSDVMIQEARNTLKEFSHVDYILLPAGPVGNSSASSENSSIHPFPSSYVGNFDLIVCFDVFPHCDLHVIFCYLKAFRRLLRPPQGKIFLSVADLTTPMGWERFQRQKSYSEGGFYFLAPQLFFQLVEKAGLKVVKFSQAWNSQDFQQTENNKKIRDNTRTLMGHEALRVRQVDNLYYNRDLVCELALAEEIPHAAQTREEKGQ